MIKLGANECWYLHLSSVLAQHLTHCLLVTVSSREPDNLSIRIIVATNTVTIIATTGSLREIL